MSTIIFVILPLCIICHFFPLAAFKFPLNLWLSLWYGVVFFGFIFLQFVSWFLSPSLGNFQHLNFFVCFFSSLSSLLLWLQFHIYGTFGYCLPCTWETRGVNFFSVYSFSFLSKSPSLSLLLTADTVVCHLQSALRPIYYIFISDIIFNQYNYISIFNSFFLCYFLSV